MNIFFNPKLLLLFIVLIAGFLRFWQLGTNPPSLSWDEAAWGYNAYSLGTDLRDEFGRFLPIQYFESFGDFKPPVYAYLDILPIKFFGLNEFAVRFPSAFFGTLTVIITYFLTKRILGRQIVALFATMFLAISPWHINLSRAAFEANVATFFIAVGVWLFLEGVQDPTTGSRRGKKWYLALSVVSFVLSMYTFNTARIVAPILVFILAIGFRKQLLRFKSQLVLAMLVGAILIAPLAQFLLTPQSRLRFHEVNIFSDIGVIERTNKEIENDKNAWWSRIIHNRRFAYTIEYFKHYFDHFNPSFLFIKGDGNPKFSTQDVGQLFLWDFPFLIVGALMLFRRREGYWWIIPLWLFAGIIPAATARETPHALRIEVTLPTFQIITAYGAFHFMKLISNFQIKYLVFTIYYLLLIINFLYYYHGYYVHYPREFSGEWQYGYKESITAVKAIKNQFDQINITSLLGRPYIYYLFYTKTDPRDFRKTAIVRHDGYGFTHVDGFGVYRFGEDLNKLDNDNKRILYMNASGRSPKKANIFKTIELLNGDPVFTIYEIVYVPEEQK